MGFATVLLAAATAIAEVVFKLSLIPDIYNVHRSRSIGEMAELPMITLVVNSNLWSWYAFVTENMFPLLTTQLIGEVFGIAFNIVYFRWSPPDKRKHLLKLYAYALAINCLVDIYCVLGLVDTLGMARGDLGTSLGYAGVAFTTALYVSPLGTLKRFLETKSAASISINMSIMIVVSAALWIATGVVDSDWFLVGVNSLGFLLGCVQIVLYNVYKPGRYDGSGLPDTDKVVSPKGGANDAVFVESMAYKPMLSPQEVTVV
ncbi:hypothetical protein PHYBOEH_009092 [Phytophthora boehmeriae]|uniref:Sugar transporter SWEET1 n=1 Tax=Phytophthora boehmeriae TaxID=109152 RepID=A0A8T1VWH0_9STRA|nr:hypothetical protein PHYBOEH_009092 [Phytophthora boehmeriae]